MDAYDGLIVPMAEPSELPPPAGVGRRTGLGLWVAILALVGSAAFALFYLAGSEDDSPEAAVERLLEAYSNEDVLGMLDALPPSEREPLKGRVIEIASQLKRLEVLSGDLDLGRLSGLDLAVEDLELSSARLGEGVSTVRFEGGTSRYSVTPRELPLGRLLLQLIGDGLPAQTISDAEPVVAADGGEEVVVIEEDGRWYVSIWYSVAEAARKEAGAPVPDFGAGLEARGEDSPEAAVRAMVEAGMALDARRTIELLAPDEARALHDYAPLFLPDVEREAATTRRDVDLRLDDLDVAVDQRGDEAVVSFRSLAVSGTVDGEPGSFRFDGRCVETTSEGDTDRVCADDADQLSPVPFASNLFGGGYAPELVLVRVDGEWYLSPTGTVLDALVNGLRGLEPGDIEEMVTGFQSFFGLPD